MVVLLLCHVCTLLYITSFHAMSHVVLHLEIFVIVECDGFSFDFSSLFMLHVIWFSEMISYVSAMFDFIDFHRRVTNSSIK